MAQSGLIPIATWGLTVAPNEEPEEAFGLTSQPGTLQLTMAAIDPDEDTSQNTGVEGFKKARATIKMIVLREPEDDEDEDEDDDEDLEMADLLDEDPEDSPNGEGPSDPKKSPKEMKRNALKKEIETDEGDVLANGVKPKLKGKGKASPLQDSDEDEDELDDEDLSNAGGMQEFVLCTLDPESHYQQPLNITVPIHESAAFRVTGTHSIHLTGNIVISPADEDFGGSETSGDEDVDDDLSPATSDLDMEEDEESDELDDVDDPRITELGSDEDDEVNAPKLIKKENTKKELVGKKRSAPEEDSSIIDGQGSEQPAAKTEAKVDGAPTLGPDGKPLSKSQMKKMRKKMKDNAGNAVTVEATVNGDEKKVTAEAAKESPGGKTKSVQFAEKLVQGPGTGALNGEMKKDDSEKKGAKNPRVVDGVTIDDKKIGNGPGAKKGDKVSMRYIGKLESNNKQFDANKKGPPFTFKLGTGQVIKGWDVGVAGMAINGERRIIVPAHMGYGNKKMEDIPANSTLKFDVKLLEIKK